MQSHAAELTYKTVLFSLNTPDQPLFLVGGVLFVTPSLPIRWQKDFCWIKGSCSDSSFHRHIPFFVCELHHLKFIKSCHPHHPHSSNAVDRYHSIPAPLCSQLYSICVSALSVTVTVITVEADHNLLILVLVFIKPDLYWLHIACFFLWQISLHTLLYVYVYIEHLVITGSNQFKPQTVAFNVSIL